MDAKERLSSIGTGNRFEHFNVACRDALHATIAFKAQAGQSNHLCLPW